MNLTLLSFSASVIANSPLLMFSKTYFDRMRFESHKIYMNLFFSSFMTTYSRTQSTIRKSSFLHFLNSPFHINDDSQLHCIQFRDFNKTQQFNNSALCIDSCNFFDCQNSGQYARGGAIRFECMDSNLTVYGSTFELCKSVSCGGAIFACGNEVYSFDSENNLMTHKNMNSFNSHYCCYSRCSAQIYDKSSDSSYRYSGYGSAILVASDDIELNYSASSECPQLNNNDDYAYGAQFDIKTETVKSCFINATIGDSVCCAAIEYRNAKSGFFSHQTIVNQVGSFITSFSSLEGAVNISSCNLVNNTLRYIANVDLCSLIYVMYKNVIISDFVVADSHIADSVAAHGKQAYFAAPNNNDITVTVENCQIDSSMISSVYFKLISTKEILITEHPITHDLPLLNLGNCQGVVVPPPLEESHHFTGSVHFTISNEFTESGGFTKFGKIEVDSQNNQNENKNKAPLIGGIVGGVGGAAAVGAAVFAILKHKQAGLLQIEIPEASISSSGESNIQNPIYMKNGEDDPFQNDFAEHIASLDTVN